MIVRIQLGTGRQVRRTHGKNRHVALSFGALLMPVAVMAYVMGIWRLASDMGLVVDSGITGFFSHWQVAMATAVALHSASSILNRYGRRGQFEMPRLLNLRILPLRPSVWRERAQSGD